jgi:PAS domain S-box-containing protein
MLVYLVLAGSVGLQVAAAVLAFRLIRVTGRHLAWILISIALLLMALRRVIPFLNAIAGRSVELDPGYEGIGLVLSACMLVGVTLIKPIFERIFESELELEKSERRFRSYFELPIVGIAILSSDYRWVTANDRICELLGLAREELLGRSAEDLINPEDLERERKLRRSVEEGRAEGYSLDRRFAGGASRAPTWASQAVRCVRKEDGSVDYYVTIIQDISARKAYEEGLRGSMREKEVLLRELYHRTKNNMQVICSLLNLESSSSGDPKLIEEFHVMENRIRSMSLVHEKLYQSRDLSNIDLADYIRDLCALLVESYAAEGRRPSLTTELAGLRVTIDTAIPCGLIVNELVANCLKHAFPGKREGRIYVSLALGEKGRAELGVRDDGAGISTEFEETESRGIGLRTARALASQLRGELTVRAAAGGGTSCSLSFNPASVVESRPAIET